MGLGTIFGVYNPKTTKKQGLCKFAQPGLSCNSRGPDEIGLISGEKDLSGTPTQLYIILGLPKLDFSAALFGSSDK